MKHFQTSMYREKSNSISNTVQWWQTAPAAVRNLNISFKCCSKYKSRDSFEICLPWGFQNTPNMLKLIEFWLRYLRSKTNDMILKISSKLIKIDEKIMKSTHFVSKVINSTSKTSVEVSRWFFLYISNILKLSGQSYFYYCWLTYLCVQLCSQSQLAVFLWDKASADPSQNVTFVGARHIVVWNFICNSYREPSHISL